MKRETLQALLEARSSACSAALITALESGEQILVDPAGAPDERFPYPPEVWSAVLAAVTADQSRIVETPAGPAFVQVLSPPLRMIIVGAVHIAQFLAPMAALAGYRVVVIDPRGAFATEERFTDVTLLREWPDDALAELAPDHRTAIVTLTHDPKLDDPALQLALSTPVFYIGSLGSRRTHAARLERLRAAGFEDSTLQRIDGPVGLPIGATSPAEIAVAILAQATQRLRERGLRERGLRERGSRERA